MSTNMLSLKKTGIIAVLLAANCSFAQTKQDTIATTKLEDVVVTGVVNPKARLNSSVSISVIGEKQMQQSSPRTSSEIFRLIPGVRAESSSGEGNANFSVRGVPVSEGGSRYFQIQEDGLPLNLFGDTSFGNSDNWLRVDSNIGRIEAIRGGSASTQTSNGPAGIINFISKTGNTEGGSVGTSFGLNYQTSRLDFEYGTPLGNGLSYHVGGFMNSGEGPRSTGFTANTGGQLKFNLTKVFEKGYIRTYFKFLNDRSAMYMPMPMLLEGTDDNPTYSNLPGFDITTDGLQTKYLQESPGISSFDNSRRNGDVRNGNNPISKAIGMEFSFDLGDGWKVMNKGRVALNSGEFVAPFSANVGKTATIANGALGAINGSNPAIVSLTANPLVYADSQSTPREAYNPSNGLLQIIHLFDVTIDDMSNFVNDFKITKKLSDKITATAGYFTAIQNTKTSWQWYSYLQEVKGGGEARLVDFNGFSRGGQYAYGTPVWGNCCQRKYNTTHAINSPYLGINADIIDNLNFDGSVRFENVRVSGSIGSGNTVGRYDVNANGIIEGIENNVPIVQPNQNQIIGDSYKFISYSAGLNYKLDDKSAVFGRYSVGASGRAADRNGYAANGTAATQYDQVSQMELGYKKKFEGGYANITGFNAKTDEDKGSALNIPSGALYKAIGLEIDGSISVKDNLSIIGSITWTDSKIVDDRVTTGSNNGNRPQRQAAFVYNLSPVYSFGKNNQHLLGLTILGTSKSYAGNNNTLVQPGYAYLNLLTGVGLTKALALNFNINNLLDTVGITEVNGVDGPTGDGNRYVRARSITGRSASMSLLFKF